MDSSASLASNAERSSGASSEDGAGARGQGLFSRMLTKLNTLWVTATYPFAGKGRNLRIHYASEIARHLATRIWFGNDVEVGKHVWLTCGMDGEHKVQIVLESGCCLGPRSAITANNSIHLERNVVLEPEVLVMDHGHAYEDASRPIKAQGPTAGGRIRIGEGCRIGQGAAILCERGELVLGRNCVVAPRAVVVRSFPPNSVIAGNLARIAQRPAASPPASGHEAPGTAAGELAKQEC